MTQSSFRERPSDAPLRTADAHLSHGAGKTVVASLIGTSLEFYDHFIFGIAALFVFPKLFFPEGDPRTAALLSLLAYAIAFAARPLGAALFGHFGDRLGRKRSLVLTLLLMGCSTVLIGLLPGYERIGWAAPIALATFRFGQGLALVASGAAPPSWSGKLPRSEKGFSAASSRWQARSAFCSPIWPSPA